MKKTYLLITGLLLIGAAFGQGIAPNIKTFPGQNEDATPHKFTRAPQPASRGTFATPFDGWFDPIYDQAFNRGLKVKGVGAQLIYYTNPIFPDSTVIISDDKGNYPMDLHALGSILDPTSSFLYTDSKGNPSSGSEGPVVTVNDPYKIDSLVIPAWYKKKKVNVQDTLYIYLSWQKPSNNNVFFKTRTSNLFNPPISTFRDSILSIYIDTLKYPQGTGNVIKPKADSTHLKLVKYVLKNTDTATVAGGVTYAKNIFIKLDKILTIPAGNVLACYFAYVPQAGSYSPGDCIYQYDIPKTKQNANGFAVKWWAADSTKHDYLVDPSSKAEGGLMLASFDRYPVGTQKRFFVRGEFRYAPAIYFHIFGTSTVGVNEVSANGNFSLGQNVPNPFTNETTISYQLKTNAKSASLVIYNVAGAKVFDQAQTNLSTGKYSVTVNASNLTPGIYFYSLIVDGSQVTKKMIITE